MTEWLDEQPDSPKSHWITESRVMLHRGKYERYFNSSCHVSQVFNDVLGFRAFCDSYNSVLALTSTSFGVADFSRGKAVDDGYRGVYTTHNILYKPIRHFKNCKQLALFQLFTGRFFLNIGKIAEAFLHFPES